MSSDATAVDPTRPLRVCAVLPSTTRGGAEVWQERVAVEDAPWELHIVAPEGSDALSTWRERGTPIHEVRAGRRLQGAARTVGDLMRVLRDVRPDVVIAHGVKAGLLSAAAAQVVGARVVWVRHDNSFPKLVRPLDMATDARVVVSDALRGDSSASLVEPPLAGEPYPRERAQEILGLDASSDRHRVVMASRLADYKGIDVAIQALPMAQNWELHVFGVIDHSYIGEQKRLEGLASDKGVAGRVVFHEPRDDASLLMTAFDAVAILTRAEPDAHVTGEAFGTTAFEGLRAGLPVIAAAPVGEVMGDAGVLVSATEPSDVARALRECADPEVHQRMTNAIPGVLAQHRLTPEEASSDLTAVLSAAASRPGAGRSGTIPFSIVTTVLNEAQGLRLLLTQLQPLLGDDDELVVVDGGSRDGTAETAREFAARDPRVTVIDAPGAGISEGRNIGIDAARHEWIACTDVGCEPSEQWLKAFRSAASAHPDAGLLTGVYTVEARNPIEHAFAACGYPDVDELRHPTALSRGYSRLFGRSFDVTLPTGRSIAFTKEAWREAGGFPENLPTGEDVTFGQRISRRRPAHLVGDAEVAWEQRASVRETLHMYARYGEGSANSGNLTLLARDGARLVAYAGAAGAFVAGGRASRTLAASGLTAYFSVPLLRAARRPQPLAALAWTPFAVVTRDLAKVKGAVHAGALRGVKAGRAKAQARRHR